MARKVFFSFQYEDVNRAMNVRNSNVIAADDKVGFIDKADFEEVEREGDAAIEEWIDNQLHGTTVTVVILGATSDKSKWVKYEIAKSIKRGNGILTIDVSKILDYKGKTTTCCFLRVPGYPHYSWTEDNGYENLGQWIENAAKAAGKS